MGTELLLIARRGSAASTSPAVRHELQALYTMEGLFYTGTEPLSGDNRETQ